MEKIKWIETPPCKFCSAPENLKRRYSCMGCEKFRRKPALPLKFPKRRLNSGELSKRNLKIAKLYRSGLSYQKIALMFGMPRATVQSAVKAANHLSGAA